MSPEEKKEYYEKMGFTGSVKSGLSTAHFLKKVRITKKGGIAKAIHGLPPEVYKKLTNKQKKQQKSRFRKINLTAPKTKSTYERKTNLVERVNYIKQRYPNKDPFFSSIRWLELREDVFVAYGKQCLKCGSKTNIHVDHIVPRSVNKDLQYDFNNLQPLCNNCNVSKGIETKDYR